MQNRWHKLGTVMMLGGYLLSTFAAGFLHDHSHSHGLDSSTCCGKTETVATEPAHGKCQHSQTTGRHSHKTVADTCHTHQPSSRDENSQHDHSHRHIPWHDDDCSVCQYSSLAQWSAPTISVTVVLDVVTTVVERYDAEPHSGALLVPLARGPPA